MKIFILLYLSAIFVVNLVRDMEHTSTFPIFAVDESLEKIGKDFEKAHVRTLMHMTRENKLIEEYKNIMWAMTRAVEKQVIDISNLGGKRRPLWGFTEDYLDIQIRLMYVILATLMDYEWTNQEETASFADSKLEEELNNALDYLKKGDEDGLMLRLKAKETNNLLSGSFEHYHDGSPEDFNKVQNAANEELIRLSKLALRALTDMPSTEPISYLSNCVKNFVNGPALSSCYYSVAFSLSLACVELLHTLRARAFKLESELTAPSENTDKTSKSKKQEDPVEYFFS